VIASIAFVLLALVCGYHFASLLDARASTVTRLAEGFLLGALILGMILFTASMVGVTWSRVFVFAAVLVVEVIAIVLQRRGSPRPPVRVRGVEWLSLLLLLTSGILLAGYVALATAGPSPENDFIGIWGVKGQHFFLRGGIDFSFLQRSDHSYTHPDYPLLLPLLFDVVALLHGSWDPTTFGLLYPAFAIAVLVIAHREIEEASTRVIAAFSLLALVGVACSPWIGLAEGPLVAYGTAGLLITRRGALLDDRRLVVLGSCLLGGASLLKNEGLTLLIAAGFALLLTNRRRVENLIAFLPGVLLAASWIATRMLHDLPSDLMTAGVAGRIAEHLSHPALYLQLIARYPLGRPLLWLSIAAGLIVGVRHLRREGFLVLALALQFLAVLSAYVITPHDLDWHFKWSWERVINQLALPLAVLSIFCLSTFFRADAMDRERTNAEL
jgi:hypothetical protein